MFDKVWEILSQKEQLFFHETHQNLERIRRRPSKKEEMSTLKFSWDLSPKAINKLDVIYQNVYTRLEDHHENALKSETSKIAQDLFPKHQAILMEAIKLWKQAAIVA